jgi:hypothetical protein
VERAGQVRWITCAKSRLRTMTEELTVGFAKKDGQSNVCRRQTMHQNTNSALDIGDTAIPYPAHAADGKADNFIHDSDHSVGLSGFKYMLVTDGRMWLIYCEVAPFCCLSVLKREQSPNWSGFRCRNGIGRAQCQNAKIPNVKRMCLRV